MTRFHEIPGNHGYGAAVAASEGHVCIGLRQKNGHGEIVDFKSRADLENLIKVLQAAANEAWPNNKSK